MTPWKHENNECINLYLTVQLYATKQDKYYENTPNDRKTQRSHTYSYAIRNQYAAAEECAESVSYFSANMMADGVGLAQETPLQITHSG